MSLIINGIEIDLAKVAKETKKAQSKTKVQPTVIVKRYQAEKLEIDVSANEIDIQPHDASNIEVTLIGIQPVVDAVEMEVREQTLFITNGGGAVNIQTNVGMNIGGVIGGNGCSVSNNFHGVTFNGGFTGGDMIAIDGDNVVINTVDSRLDGALKVRIKVPVGMSFGISAHQGNIIIGDVDGDIDLELSGQAKAQFGVVHDLDMDISGSSSLLIGKVNGDIKALVSGQGRVVIDDGNIPKLNITASGTSKTQVNCVACKAKLKADGMASIYLKHAAEQLKKTSFGMAKIKVGSML